MTIEFRELDFAESKAIDPDAILTRAKQDNPEFAYAVAFTTLSYRFKEVMRRYEHAMEDVRELDIVSWAVDRILWDRRLDVEEFGGSWGDSLLEKLFFPAVELIKDLRRRGFTDEMLRDHFVTPLEIEHERLMLPSDFCLECGDREEFLPADRIFCTLCEDKFVVIADFGG
jgi:hypothetical protein